MSVAGHERGIQAKRLASAQSAFDVVHLLVAMWVYACRDARRSI